ncbi:MAG: hypothetical protein M3069_04150 [Chloroflexota bacterium]|nr:hypothetical protein [Chloroflexota bacterium]
MIRALAQAVSTKYELEDLINVAIEQLVRLRFELPAFDTRISSHQTSKPDDAAAARSSSSYKLFVSLLYTRESRAGGIGPAVRRVPSNRSFQPYAAAGRAVTSQREEPGLRFAFE